RGRGRRRPDGHVRLPDLEGCAPARDPLARRRDRRRALLRGLPRRLPLRRAARRARRRAPPARAAAGRLLRAARAARPGGAAAGPHRRPAERLRGGRRPAPGRLPARARAAARRGRGLGRRGRRRRAPPAAGRALARPRARAGRARARRVRPRRRAARPRRGGRRRPRAGGSARRARRRPRGGRDRAPHRRHRARGPRRGRRGGGVRGVLLAALVLLATAAFEAVQPLPEAARELAAASGAARRLFALTDAEPPVRDPARPLPAPAGRLLRVEGVRVRYGPGSPWVLDGVDLELAPGRTVALVGESGAGKTTLASLLPRFRDPNEGRVTLDGRDLRAYAADDVRRAVALAGQEAHLFATTIREN